MLNFKEGSILEDDAQKLIGELNEVLIRMIGNNGTGHVNPDDFSEARSAFLIGYDKDVPVCCAGIRNVDEDTCEIKRVYARKNRYGYGSELMKEVENLAASLGYRILLLECREKNPHAIAFYQKNGYRICGQYPPYVGVKDAVCLKKEIHTL